MSKFYALKGKDVFDINKVTVVGSPTITSDGVLQTADGSNYVKSILQTAVLYGKSWDIFVKVYWNGRGNGGSDAFSIGDSYSYLKISNTQELLFNAYLASDNSQVYQAKYSSSIFNTAGWYYLKLSFDYNTGTYKGYAGKSQDNLTELISITKGTGQQLRQLDTSHYILFSRSASLNHELDLTQFKIYVDGELVYTPTKPTYLLERRKPKAWNKGQFTIVGNPSISDEGVASGFSGSDYITSNYNLEENKAYTFVVEGIGGVPRTDRGSYIFSAFYSSGGSDNLRVISGLNNGIVRFALGGVMNDISTTFAISDGVKYKIELKTDFKSFVTFTDLLTGYTLTKTGYTITNQTYGNNVITYGANKGVAPLTNGSIDLKQFKIYTDNNLVFDGGADTYVYDASKFTVVGSPTITADGVASGFSSSDYLVTPSINYSTVKSYEFRLRINSGEIPSDNSMYFGIQRILYLYQNKNAQIVFVDTTSGSALRFLAEQNVLYDIVCGHDENNLFYLKYKKISNEDYTITSGVVKIRTSANEALNIGCYSGGGYPLLTGSIDLPQFSITVDGKELFTGAKENYYMLRR